jgi:glutaredoxin 3
MTQQSNQPANRNETILDAQGQSVKEPVKVEIYTWRFCPYCIRAKGILDRKGVIYSEYMIDGDETARQAMKRRAEGRNTLPQIFINNRGIGGCDDLLELDQRGLLNPLLGLAA